MNKREGSRSIPHCLCGAWADPDDYGGGHYWDRSEDWCPYHGGRWRRNRTLRLLRAMAKTGQLSQERYEELRDQ